MKLNIDKINSEMQRLNMTNQDFANKMGVTRQRVWQIMQGYAKSFKTVTKIAKVFNLDPKDLII